MGLGGYQVRMYDEYGQLHHKIEKLKNFINSDRFETLPDIERDDLEEQLSHMQSYFKVLSRRVSRLCDDPQEKESSHVKQSD